MIIEQLNPTVDTPQASSSRAVITELAHEILASVPQLAGTLPQVQAIYETEQDSESEPVSISALENKMPKFTPLPEVSRKNSSAAIEYCQVFVYDPGPIRVARSSTSAPRPPPAESSHDRTIGRDAPPQASMFHLLLQLYGLWRLRTLPEDMRKWIRDSIHWLESCAEIEDLVRVHRIAERHLSVGFDTGLH